MLHLRCFGSVSIIDGAGEERQLRSRKHVGLLLYLVSRPRSAHSRDDLASLLWDGTGRRERHSLSQALYDIRSNVDRILDVDTNTIQLRSGRIEYEAEGFEQAVESGDHETALELYRGDFAPDLVDLGAEFFDRWLEAERERHRVLATIALRNAQRVSEDRGDWDRMCLAALRLVHLNEFDEEAHAALMRGLWMKGDPASALRHYRSLDHELVAGWSELQDLARRLDKSGSVREVLTVPARPTPLIGREREFEELFELVRTYRSTGGSILICGEPGVGKTAFLKEFARVTEVRGGQVTWWGGTCPTWITDPAESTEVDITIHDGGAPPKRKTHPSRALRIYTSRDPRARTTAVDSHVAVIRLPRLSERDICGMIRTVFSECPPRLRTTAAHLSAGNPGLATEIVRALNGSWNDEWSIERTGRTALRRSLRLRDLVEACLECLGTTAREVLRFLAALTPAARDVSRKLLSKSQAEALRTLRERDLAGVDGVAIWIVHPVIAVALRIEAEAGAEQSLALSIQRLAEGGPKEKLAAAAELSVAGIDNEAVALLINAATDALATGDFGVATQAGDLAIERATASIDRLRAAAVTAEAELARGRPRRAECLIRSLRDQATTSEQRVVLDTLLLRATAEAESSFQWGTLAERVRAAYSTLPADVRLLTELQLQTVELVTQPSSRPQADFERRARQLEDQIRVVLSRGLEPTAPILEALRHLFFRRATHVSITSGEQLLRRFGWQIADCIPASRNFLEMARAFLEVRKANLGVARELFESITDRVLADESRTTAASLNNLAVTLTDLGDFGRAEELFCKSVDIDNQLGSVGKESALTLLNRAQLKWFAGDCAAAVALSRRAMELAREDRAVSAVGTALCGLVALDGHSAEEAIRAAERLEDVDAERLAAQDRYLVLWFKAALAAKEERQAYVEHLLDEAQRMEALDVLSASKLRVIAANRAPAGNVADHGDLGRRLLRSSGSGWFLRFERRYSGQFN